VYRKKYEKSFFNYFNWQIFSKKVYSPEKFHDENFFVTEPKLCKKVFPIEVCELTMF